MERVFSFGERSNLLFLQKIKSMFEKLSIHRVGNKINQEPLFLSEEEQVLDENMNEFLSEFFLKSFKSEENFRFFHESNIENNEIYTYVSEIFEDKELFHENSKKIAKYLYDITDNPRVLAGECYVVYFQDEGEEGAKIDSIGIFKTEKKETFLKVFPHDEVFEINKDFGFNLNKIDKGCLIYNTQKEEGFVVKAFDNHKNGDAEYWMDKFLSIRQRYDEYFSTENTLSVYKNYITNQLPQEFEDISKIDQADFLNRSMDFFKERESFSFDEFAGEVLQDENLIESFSNYKSEFEQEYQVDIADDFAISNAAVKKQARHFKSVIKLDKDFHIYVHGDRKKIEQGSDEKGKFYKVYYDKES